jgi:hypothetical protein
MNALPGIHHKTEDKPMFTKTITRNLLKTTVAATLVGLTVATAVAQTGSFALTCKEISVTGGTLFAKCLRINGSWVSASLDFTRCSKTSMTNLDGVLVCGP